MPRGRSTVQRAAQRRPFPEASNSTSNVPLPARSALQRLRPRARLLKAPVGADLARDRERRVDDVGDHDFRGAGARAATTVSAPIGPAPVTSTRLPSNGPGPAYRRAGRRRAARPSRPRRARALGDGTACARRTRSSRESRPARAAYASRCRRSACRGSGSAGPRRQYVQWLQGRLGLIATRVPGPGPVTSAPTARPRRPPRGRAPSARWMRTMPKPP